MTDRQREQLIHRITLWHTIAYRQNGLKVDGKVRHEPSRFRSNLFNIYTNLSDDDLVSLNELLTFKNTEK